MIRIVLCACATCGDLSTLSPAQVETQLSDENVSFPDPFRKRRAQDCTATPSGVLCGGPVYAIGTVQLGDLP